MRLRGLDRMRTVALGVRRRMRRRTVVLLYHRVAHVESDPFGLSVTPAHFAEQMDAVRRVAVPISLRQLAGELADGRVPRRGVVVTFDDGYLDNLEYALPILARLEIPGTVFVPGGFINTTCEYWWDALARAVLGPMTLPERLELTVDKRTYQWSLRGTTYTSAADALRRGALPCTPQSTEPRHALLLELHRLLKPRSAEAQEQLAATLKSWAGVPAQAAAGDRVMTGGELRSLTEGGLMEVGAHTSRHLRLSARTAKEQAEEIQTGRQQLEHALGRTVESFAYPFGGHDDYSSETVSVLREQGFASACANFPEAVGRDTERLEIPRFHVLDCPGRQFEQRLLTWLDS